MKVLIILVPMHLMYHIVVFVCQNPFSDESLSNISSVYREKRVVVVVDNISFVKQTKSPIDLWSWSWLEFFPSLCSFSTIRSQHVSKAWYQFSAIWTTVHLYNGRNIIYLFNFLDKTLQFFSIFGTKTNNIWHIWQTSILHLLVSHRHTQIRNSNCMCSSFWLSMHMFRNAQ